MKSTQVYKAIREVIAPWCKESGFKRTSGGMLGWYKAVDEKFIVFWFQCSQDGWNDYSGSSFCVEFQISDSPHIGDGHANDRQRLPHFLTGTDLEEVRQKQNCVIAKLVRPPKDYFIFQMDKSVVKRYLKEFLPVKVAYTEKQDIWFRYKEEEDVVMWAEFVLERLPTTLAKITASSVQT